MRTLALFLFAALALSTAYAVRRLSWAYGACRTLQGAEAAYRVWYSRDTNSNHSWSINLFLCRYDGYRKHLYLLEIDKDNKAWLEI